MAKLSNLQIQALKERKASCLYWVQNDKILFPPNIEFDPFNFMFQLYLFGAFPLRMDGDGVVKQIQGFESRVMGAKKAAQIGVTVWVIITSIHGLRFGIYPNGIIHLFPTDGDALDISSTKVQPLLDINPNTIKPFVGKVDKLGVRQIGQGYYYMRGAGQTRKINDESGSSSRGKSITADRLIFDEYDEMDMDMVELFKKRIYASKRKEEVYISTPTLPDYGIDKLYNDSNQCTWTIKCSRCGKHTCLELEFPDILLETLDGRVFRICRHCREPLSKHDIASGQWVPLYPSRTKDLSMVWISSLGVPGRDPGAIYKMLQSNDPIVLKNLYNSDLALPYQQSEDSLSKADVYACCGLDVARMSSLKANAMGVDVKSDVLHVVVGYPKSDRSWKILWFGRVEGFNDLYDIAKRMNVRCAVIDYEPQTRKVREFRDGVNFTVYMIDYQERLKAQQKIDDKEGILTVRRTETMDKVVSVFKEQTIEIPRQSTELKVYTKEMTKSVKVLQEDKMTGSRRFVWKKVGEEHYFHATNYFLIASGDYKIISDNKRKSTIPKPDDNADYDPFDTIRGNR